MLEAARPSSDEFNLNTKTTEEKGIKETARHPAYGKDCTASESSGV